MGIQSELDLMGLFQGVGLPFQSESAPVQMPNMVWLYRVPILLYWAEHEESLGAIITHVLVHEIGHHFGLSDDDMYGIERAGGITEEMTMKVTGACHCGAITIEGEADPEKVNDLPLHRLPDRHRLGVSRLGADPRQRVQDERPADQLREDHGGQRQSARAGVLRPSAARRSIRPRRAKASRRPTWCGSAFCAARPARAEEAELVPLGAELGDAAWMRIHKNQKQA